MVKAVSYKNFTMKEKKLKYSAEKEILCLALPATNTDTGIQFGH